MFVNNLISRGQTNPQCLLTHARSLYHPFCSTGISYWGCLLRLSWMLLQWSPSQYSFCMHWWIYCAVGLTKSQKTTAWCSSFWFSFIVVKWLT